MDRCGKCSKYMWQQRQAVKEQQQPSTPVAVTFIHLCPVCRRNSIIQSKLEEHSEGRTEANVSEVEVEVEVSTLLHASLDGQLHVQSTQAELDRRKQKREELERALRGARCIKVMHRKETLGDFRGKLVDLIKLVSDAATNARQLQAQGKRQVQRQATIGCHKQELPEIVPRVHICIDGGPGSVFTVCDIATGGRGCLLVKGSGRAACLLSDAVLLKNTRNMEDKKGIYDEKLLALSDFLTKELGMKRDGAGGFDYTQLACLLTQCFRQLEVKRSQFAAMDWPKFRQVECTVMAAQVSGLGCRVKGCGFGCRV